MSTAAIYVLRLASVVLALYGLAVAQSLVALAVFPAEPIGVQAPAGAMPMPTDARIGYTA